MVILGRLKKWTLTIVTAPLVDEADGMDGANTKMEERIKKTQIHLKRPAGSSRKHIVLRCKDDKLLVRPTLTK